MSDIGLLIVLGLVLAAEFVNGWTDAPNAIATVVGTRVLSPMHAVIMAALLNLLGALSGTAVAYTIGKGFVDANVISIQTVGAAMVGIVAWSTLAWKFGLPTSETHALVSGLAGAAYATGGLEALRFEGWVQIGKGILFSTFLGFGGGFLIILGIVWMFRKARPDTVSRYFGRLQVLSAALMAFSHGSNDGQKFIGTFSLALVLGGVLPKFEVKLWVVLLCATMMGIGTATGGWRIIHTMGTRLTRLKPVQGFAAETGAGLVILLASALAIPLSTTHTISTSIMGVGTLQRWSAVRWRVVREIVTAWVLTFPAAAIIAWACVRGVQVFRW